MIRVWGISFYLHPLFVIIMLLSVLTGQFLELLTLFAIVLVHELGHVWAAILAGATVKSVQLLPFGGVAVIEDNGKLTAFREIGIALAGPFQNILMIAFVWALKEAGWGSDAYMTYLIQANLIIALFNMLPILPLDGGRIVQAAVSLQAPYYSTLLWCGRISILASALTAVYALLPLGNGGGIRLNLLMIAVFLLYSNITDHRNLPFRFMVFLMNRGAIYEQHMDKGTPALPIVAPLAKPLDDILRLFKRHQYHLIYVLDAEGGVMAVVPEQRLLSSYFGI
ncbi:stage IV sporulation protein FB [Paenibacillus forsythiae]|uniref:Stage IV sporulation protein FB n=1 Tax=Paenibacillus forsythiae TaxID=365616 RepID=A0ABU3HED8_9BACL|nr:M50 family metallopeptidase [Paenibacillus forsythiae]MDT3429080.1 stage IV sporulation protein FB [Paenibacillus forsythiae]